ncbi:hypothetical protein [Halobaculum sp. D14]|uniref:hypothetical protein n=1 Tax=unclassified Halobaculum TaxID=2640896 RepID=UPI003EBCC54F
MADQQPPASPRARARRVLLRVAAVTAVAHALLAAAVYRDAADRDVAAGRWSGLTLLTGVFGAAAYRRRRR